MDKCFVNLLTSFLIVVCFLASVGGAQENNQPPGGYIPIFSGRNIQGWTGGTDRNPAEIAALADDERKALQEKWKADVAQHWRVEAGELINDGQGAFLVTEKEFANFELWVDWRIGPGGDSGIYLRGIPQVQIWDNTNAEYFKYGAQHGSGGLWNNEKSGRFPSKIADRPIGEWNRMHIRMVGPWVTVRLNDVEVISNQPIENYFECSRPVPLRGPICLQTHGGETRFRNVFVREIPFDESARILAEANSGDEGFEPLFNGRDLSGWMGATKSYEVVGDAIQCLPKGEGSLLTEDEFDDFVVRMEFKLPPGGNSGLAIRSQPSDVTPAYDAFEIQVLDDSAETYADLEKYQYHGSLYGLQPAIRGYLRPVGEWNYQEITVIGDSFRVKLNGFEILNVSLRHLPSENLDHEQHPGNARTKGHFGFCGHNDPVAFRNIRIKRLPSK